MRNPIVAALLVAACVQSPDFEPTAAGPAAVDGGAALLGPAGPDGVTFRARLGNNVEGLTPIFQTPFLSLLAAIDGYDVVAIPVFDTPPGVSLPSVHFKLFDVRGLSGGVPPPRGIAFDPGRQQFYFGTAAGGPNPVILVTDPAGHPLPPITLTLLPGQVTPVQFEGLAYLPPDLPRFADRIAAVLVGEDLLGRISIVRLDGTVEYEVPVVPGSPAEAYVTGLAFVAPDRFLFTPLTDIGSAVYQTDLDGTVTGPILTGEPAFSFEGIAALPGGRVAVSEYAIGRILVYDEAGAHLAHQDRDFHVGVGISNPESIAWDSSSGHLLVNALVGGGLAPRNVFALPPPFSTTQQVTHLELTEMTGASGVAYLADENAVAVCETYGPSPTRGVWFFDAVSGDYLSRLSLASFPRDAFRPRRVTQLPGGQLALRVRQHPDLVQVITRAGTPDPGDPTAFVPDLVRTVTLSAPQPVFSGLDFDSVPGYLLVNRQYYDLDGTALVPLTGVPADFLGTSFIRLTSGPFAGQIAGIDPAASELVIFQP